jgi:uncharacterized protein with PIN domain
MNDALTPTRPSPPIFWCDAGLGGLARWLRAAGYESHWRYGIDDVELLAEAQKISATILTTDTGLMERRVIVQGIIPALCVSPTLRIPDQMAIVFRELKLEIRTPRCMACGGELQIINKEDWREKIPPKTYAWLDEYFLCSRCGKLFWRGTHWRRIGEQLAKLKTSYGV